MFEELLAQRPEGAPQVWADSAYSSALAVKGLRKRGYKSRINHNVTSPKQVADWLVLVHIVISNLKSILLGTINGVSYRHMQEYIDEFVFRFNHRRLKIATTLETDSNGRQSCSSSNSPYACLEAC